ncbi:hypothetical protein [Hymenobacter bucti]|uniref:PH domain-containing protein n=1 Tax=Hymenobacter bucti TaxID=1844114 RepID=A0ABW4QXQ7_9BACT
MNISWLTYQQGRWVFWSALTLCWVLVFLSVWLKSEDIIFNVVTAVFWSIAITFWHCRGYYITVEPSATLCFRDSFRTFRHPCASLARVESISGFSYQLVLTTGEAFLFSDHPSRNGFGKQPERARELAAIIKDTCASA